MRRHGVTKCLRLLRDLQEASAGRVATEFGHQFSSVSLARCASMGPAASALQVVFPRPPAPLAATQLGARSLATTAEAESDWPSLNMDGIIYPDSEMEVGAPAPDFSGAPAVVGGEITTMSLSQFQGKHVVLLWYPKDFTFVCPTEIIAFNDRAADFAALGAQVIAASTDTPEVHLAWIKTPRARGGLGHMDIPMLADVTKSIAARYGVLIKDAGIALRGLFIIDDKGVVQHATINSLGVGRNVDEALRTLQAIQFVAEHGEVCPAGWKPGDKTMIADPEKSLDYFQAANAAPDVSTGDSPLHEIKDEHGYQSLIGNGKVMVKFWAPWCGKCAQISPFVDGLASRHAGSVTVASFDTTNDKLEKLAADIGVKALPAFRFFSGGKQVLDTVIGYKPAKVEEALKKLADM